MTVETILKELGAHFFTLGKTELNYGPHGRMLLRNLEKHWFLHCVTMSPYNIFLADKFSDILKLDLISKDGSPFGIANIENVKNSWNQSILPSGYKLNTHRTSKVTIFNDSLGSKDLFHKVEKERKVWWRKLARYPSRFTLTEAKKVTNVETVEIEAQFPFGNVVVETVTRSTNMQKLSLQVEKDLSKTQMVEHATSLDWGFLALLCDAYNSKEPSETRIHSRLAPYKATFRLTLSENDVLTNAEKASLNRFMLYLNNTLRMKGFDTILTNSERTIDTSFVPFTILIDKTSIENGIVHITNRSTTLSQAVHVTELVKYISMHC